MHTHNQVDYGPHIHSTTPDEIGWKETTFYKNLNRKTLVLNTFFYGELVFTDQCKVYPTEELYRQISKVIDMKQTKYNERRKGNKL